jgi:glycosyltransferase involved in cell wall biosynthesis
MDVLVFQPYIDGFGGSERVVLEIARKFNSPIYCVDYAKEKTYEEFSEFEIRKIPPSMMEHATNAVASLDRDRRMMQVSTSSMRILNMKLKEDYDVISAHLPPSEWIRNRNPRVCWYCHGPNAAFKLYDIMFRERNFYERALLHAGCAYYRSVELPIMKKMEKICTCSEVTAEKIRKHLGRDDAEVIYPAVDLGRFSCAGHEKFFLYVSRMVPEKQFEYAIEAFKKSGLAKKGWKLVLAGHMFGNLRNRLYLERLQKMAEGNAGIKIEENPGDEKVRDLYSRCSAMVFSSYEEDWGIVILEAMASSKPVISVNRGGPTISVVNGKTGFLVNSPDEMAEKMRYLAVHPDACESMGKAGRKRVEQNYTWKIFMGRMEKALKETARM